MLCSMGKSTVITKNSIRKKYQKIKQQLDEKSRRLWCATEALSFGKGGVAIVHAATKVSRPTIYVGMEEIQRQRTRKQSKRIRKKGGGAKSVASTMPGIVCALEALVDAETKGDPESALRWTNKSIRKLSTELKKQKFDVSPNTVALLLKKKRLQFAIK